MSTQNKVVVIFAGGSGKRLWPLSTAKTPKQINPTFSKESMVVEAYRRALQSFDKKNIIIVTTKQLLKATKKLLPLDDKNIIVQPCNADTAVAMCLAAMYVDALFPESVAVFMYSDQYIGDDKKFLSAIDAALNSAAKEDKMIIIGTQPTFANIGFGYIKLGQKSGTDIYEVEDFKEKPTKPIAAKIVKSGEWLWNTGIKVWKIATLLKAIKSAAPEMYDMMLRLRVEIGGGNYLKRLEEYYADLHPTSFESEIASKLPQLYVMKADYYWEDIGDWQTVYKLAQKDKFGNVVKILTDNKAPVKLLETKNSLVMSTVSQKVVLIDVDDIIVVQTKDALLVCKKEMTPRVKEVAD